MSDATHNLENKEITGRAATTSINNEAAILALNMTLGGSSTSCSDGYMENACRQASTRKETHTHGDIWKTPAGKHS